MKDDYSGYVVQCIREVLNRLTVEVLARNSVHHRRLSPEDSQPTVCCDHYGWERMARCVDRGWTLRRCPRDCDAERAHRDREGAIECAHCCEIKLVGQLLCSAYLHSTRIRIQNGAATSSGAPFCFVDLRHARHDPLLEPCVLATQNFHRDLVQRWIVRPEQ